MKFRRDRKERLDKATDFDDAPLDQFPADDFGDEHGDPFYDRPMPGAEARKALRIWRGWPADTGQQEGLEG